MLCGIAMVLTDSLPWNSVRNDGLTAFHQRNSIGEVQISSICGTSLGPLLFANHHIASDIGHPVAPKSSMWPLHAQGKGCTSRTLVISSLNDHRTEHLAVSCGGHLITAQADIMTPLRCDTIWLILVSSSMRPARRNLFDNLPKLMPLIRFV